MSLLKWFDEKKRIGMLQEPDPGMIEIERRLNESNDARFIADRKRNRAALYAKINKWRLRFELWSKERQYAESYYRDAASGLAIALQEIDRERYERENHGESPAKGESE